MEMKLNDDDALERWETRLESNLRAPPLANFYRIVKGSQAWTSPEGENVAIEYVADANGYQVLSANPPLPTPPPIPEAIKRAIEWIAAHPSKE